MNIELINNKKNICDLIFRKYGVLEVYKNNDSSYEVDLSFYDPEKKVLKNIAPNLKKYDYIPVYNCIWNSSDIYFATHENAGESVNISINKYDCETDEFVEIITFSEDGLSPDNDKRVKVFVLSEKYIIAQCETKIDTKTKSQMGNIMFSQTLYDCKTKEGIIVKDLNLINNGINTIIPVNETSILLKTGYSHFEDARIQKLNETDALIESVYYVGTSVFISSIMLENTSSNAKMLGTTYLEKSILAPKVEGDYIYFTTMDINNNISETTFFNYVTGETIKAVNNEPDQNDLLDAYIINNKPYIRNSYENRVELFNVKDSDVDMIFYDETFITVLGNLLIFKSRRRNADYLRIYSSINLELILEERCRYLCGCYDKCNYFLYIDKNEIES